MFCIANSAGIDYSYGFGHDCRLTDRRCTHLGILSRKNMVTTNLRFPANPCKGARPGKDT